MNPDSPVWMVAAIDLTPIALEICWKFHEAVRERRSFNRYIRDIEKENS